MTRMLPSREINLFETEGELLYKDIYSPDAIASIEQLIQDGMSELDKRDLHTRSLETSKTLVTRELAHMIHQLTKQSVIRIAATKYHNTKYDADWAAPSDLFCVAPIIAMGILYLEPHEEMQRGDFKIIAGKKRFDLTALGTKSILIAFSPVELAYGKNELDPIVHAWKRDGLNFGDPLPSSSHPVIFKR